MRFIGRSGGGGTRNACPLSVQFLSFSRIYRQFSCWRTPLPLEFMCPPLGNPGSAIHGFPLKIFPNLDVKPDSKQHIHQKVVESGYLRNGCLVSMNSDFENQSNSLEIWKEIYTLEPKAKVVTIQ